MANYEYAERDVTIYAIILPDTVAVAITLPYKNSILKQKYKVNDMDFLRLNIGEGTKVVLRQDLDKPYIGMQF